MTKIAPFRFRPAVSAVLLCLPLLSALPAQARTLAQVKQAGSLRLATSADFEPFNGRKGGVLYGFEVDLGDEIAHRLGVQSFWTTEPFDTIFDGLGAERYDMVIASHAITEARAKVVTFDNPHYCTGGVFLSPKSERIVNSLSLKKTTKVAAESGAIYNNFMVKMQKLGRGQLVTYPDAKAALAATISGDADTILTDKFAALDAIKTYPAKNFVSSKLMWTERDASAVRLGNTTLSKAVNEALAAIMKDGTYTKLSEKYFGQDIRC